MSTRVEGYGFTKEINDKIRAKYDLDDEYACLDWIEKVIFCHLQNFMSYY